jgi:ABC-type branched-subunit amino acid transport system substrate-binding protein
MKGVRWGIRSRRAAVTGVAALAAAIMAGCSSTAAPSTSSGNAAASAKVHCPIDILMLTSLSGADSSWGTSNLAGAKVAVAHINSTGGVLGCHVALTVKDDGSNVSQDLPLVIAATTSYNYPLVVDDDDAAGTTASYINSHHLLEITPGNATGAVEPQAPYPTEFQTTDQPTKSMIAVAKYAIGQGYKHVALITDNSADGAPIPGAIEPYLKAAGGGITDREAVNPSSVDFTSAIERARASNPQAVLINLYGPASAHVRTEIHDSGWKIPVISGNDDSDTPFQGLLPLADLNGEVTIGDASDALTGSALQMQFIQAVEKGGVQITASLDSYTNIYDALLLFAWAANETHSLNAATLATKLHDSGSAQIPGLVQGPTTGYTPTSGEWNGRLAVMKEGFFNLGRLAPISYTTG